MIDTSVFASLLFFCCVLSHSVTGDDYAYGGMTTYAAIVNLTYRDPITGDMRTEEEDMGLYASESRIDDEWGWVVHVRTATGTNDACTPPINVPAGERWIALIERGSCRFHQKIINVAVVANASAVVVYNNENNQLLSMKHKGID